MIELKRKLLPQKSPNTILFMSRLLFYTFFILTVLPIHLSAQFGQGGTKAIEKLQQTETLVVLGYDDEYNEHFFQ